MNALDLAVLAVVAVSAVFAFARGLTRETLSIVAWGGASLITVYGFNYAYGIVLRFIATPMLAELAAGAGLFLSSLIVLTIMTGSVAHLVQKSALSPIDRTLGLIFGLARGAVLVCLAYLVVDISLPPIDRPGWLTTAATAPYLAQGADALRNLLPETLQVKSLAVVDEAQHALDHATEARRAMGALSNPAPAAPVQPGREPAPAYRPGEQHDLDRLIRNTR